MTEPCDKKIAEDTAFLNDPDNSVGSLAKKIGISDKCQQITGTQTTAFMTDGKLGFGGITDFGIGGGYGAITASGNTLDRSLLQAGCGVFSVTANTLLNSTRNISCILNNTSSNVTISTGEKTAISITVGTVQDVSQMADDILKKIGEANKMVLTSNRGTDTDSAYRYKMDMVGRSITNMQNSYNKLINDNKPGSVTDTTITALVTNITSIKSTQNIAQDDINLINNEVKNIAGAVAFNKLSQASGVDSLTSNSITALQQKIKNTFDSQTNNIKNFITGTKVTVDNSSGVTITVAGGITGSILNLTANTLVDLSVEQVVKSAIAIGNLVSSSIIASLSSSGDTSTKTAGEEALLREINDGLAKQIKLADEGQNNFFSSINNMITNGFIIAAVVAVAVVFFVPIVVPSLANIFPPPIKYALLGILAYLIVAWFISWPPFSKPTPDKRIDEMSIPNIYQGQGMRKSYNSTGLKKSEKKSQFIKPYISNFDLKVTK